MVKVNLYSAKLLSKSLMR